MNKKGLLFHWIVFGALAAIALVVVVQFDTDLGSTVKGEWQLNFLDNYYLEAEKVAVLQDVEIKDSIKAAWEILAADRGFVDVKPCGEYNYVPIWEHKGECSLEFPDKIIEVLDLEGLEPLKEAVVGKLAPIVVKSENVTYSQDFKFHLTLGYILNNN